LNTAAFSHNQDPYETSAFRVSGRIRGLSVENAVQVEPLGEFELKGIRHPVPAFN